MCINIFLNDYSPGRMIGKKITSRMEWTPVNSMIIRSTPMPIPLVGGMPWQIDSMNSYLPTDINYNIFN